MDSIMRKSISLLLEAIILKVSIGISDARVIPWSRIADCLVWLCGDSIPYALLAHYRKCLKSSSTKKITIGPSKYNAVFQEKISCVPVCTYVRGAHISTEHANNFQSLGWGWIFFLARRMDNYQTNLRRVND